MVIIDVTKEIVSKSFRARIENGFFMRVKYKNITTKIKTSNA